MYVSEEVAIRADKGTAVVDAGKTIPVTAEPAIRVPGDASMSIFSPGLQATLLHDAAAPRSDRTSANAFVALPAARTLYMYAVESTSM